MEFIICIQAVYTLIDLDNTIITSTPFGSARTTIPFYPECPKRAHWATLKHTHSGVIPAIAFTKVFDSFDNVMYTNAICMGLAFPYGASSYGIHLL